ncbi:Hypothetical predicted protein [Podarcis lilfordi]|uniref:Uncharacterized protein n=1 Tax=Podarcis lilfordi TaxID=74358 RepID=A0AA35K7K3_9SAUR|nr:Hypothetical predicted protein [Podarcis lilfordi]
MPLEDKIFLPIPVCTQQWNFFRIVKENDGLNKHWLLSYWTQHQEGRAFVLGGPGRSVRINPPMEDLKTQQDTFAMSPSFIWSAPVPPTFSSTISNSWSFGSSEDAEF